MGNKHEVPPNSVASFADRFIAPVATLALSILSMALYLSNPAYRTIEKAAHNEPDRVRSSPRSRWACGSGRGHSGGRAWLKRSSISASERWSVRLPSRWRAHSILVVANSPRTTLREMKVNRHHDRRGARETSQLSPLARSPPSGCHSGAIFGAVGWAGTITRTVAR